MCFRQELTLEELRPRVRHTSGSRSVSSSEGLFHIGLTVSARVEEGQVYPTMHYYDVVYFLLVTVDCCGFVFVYWYTYIYVHVSAYHCIVMWGLYSAMTFHFSKQ